MASIDQIELPNGESYDIQDNRPAVQSVNNLPQEIASFDGAAALPMPSLKVAIEPQQDLHGYDHPWVGGAGKNKYWLIPATKRGLTLTANDDGTYTLTGDYIGTSSNTIGNSDNVVLKAGTYILNSGVESSFYGVDVWNDGLSTLGTSYGEDVTFTISSDTNVIFRIYIKYNASMGSADVTFRPMLRLSGTTSEFEPYSNICPISGHTEADVSVSPLNIAPLYNGQIYGDGRWISSSMRLTNASSTQDNSYFLKAGTYTLDYDKLNSNAPSLLQCSALTKDDNYTIIDNFADAWNNLPFTFTLTQDGYLYFTVRKDADTVINPSDYKAKILGHTYTIDLGGTRYGGTLDVVSGVLTVDRAMVELDGGENWALDDKYSSFNRFYIRNDDIKKYDDYTSHMICNECEIAHGYAWYTNVMGDFAVTGYTAMQSNNNYLYVAHKTIATVEALKTYLSQHPLQVVYELATPQTYQLTPTQVKSLLGQNNIWADTGKILECEYVRDKYDKITAKISEYADKANTAIDAQTVNEHTVDKDVPSNAVFTDTKNTAGSTDTSSKLFLIGATSQAANPQTYSDNEVYTTSGVLTTKSVQVGGGSATMEYSATTKSINFVFAN